MAVAFCLEFECKVLQLGEKKIFSNLRVYKILFLNHNAGTSNQRHVLKTYDKFW